MGVLSGYPSYFVVPDNHPVLQHPLYLKYNVKSMGDIAGSYKNTIKTEIAAMIPTNDNMAILWYLQNLLVLISRLE